LDAAAAGLYKPATAIP